MLAFNDYCFVCGKMCNTSSVYCSEECKVQDANTQFEFEFNNVPALISPVLQPRGDTIVSTLGNGNISGNGSATAYTETEVEEDDEYKHSEYLIKSPLLLAPTTGVKDQEKIAGLTLDEMTPRTEHELDMDEVAATPLTELEKKQKLANLLATSSNNYKKWLQSHS